MNTKILLPLLLIILTFSFVSCEKDDDSADKPKITISELGHENSKKVKAGEDLHIEAEIVAEGKISKVIVEIHHEEEHGSIKTTEQEFELKTTYDEFSGLKNATFHKHIDIPATAEASHYHFHFIVNDMEGQQTTVEEEIEITK